MSTNDPIEKWTREQCEGYLKQYPSSLKSDAVRKRLRVLTPQPQTPQPPKATKIGYNGNVADVVGAVKGAKEGSTIPPKNTTHGFKSQSTSAGQQKTSGSTYVDELEKGMAIVGKVVLTILVIVLCVGIVWLYSEFTGDSSFRAYVYYPVGSVVFVPLMIKIWKKY